MISSRLFLTVVLTASFLAAQDKGKANADKIPTKVMDALRARFPNPEIHQWSSEKEHGSVLYDIEFRQGGRKFEADIREDGAIQNWERKIAVDDVPAIVRKAVDTRYRKATFKAVMELTDVRDGKDTAAGYEIVLATASQKEVEVTVTADGKILEDSDVKK